MRVLYLSADPGVPVFGPKGASVHLRSMAAALDELGHDVVIASPRVERGANRLPAGVRCIEIPAVRAEAWATPGQVLAQSEIQAEAVKEIAAWEGCEGIYERYSLSSFAGARAATALSVPLALEVNAPLRLEAKRFRRLVHEPLAILAEQEAFSAARTIFAVSRALAQWLVESGVETTRVEVMSNAPPERAFAEKQPIPDQAELVVGFAGGLKPWHGIGTLLRGFELALRNGASMRLEILGDGPANALVDRALLPDDRLIRHGHLFHVEALDVLATWDVGVAPFDPVPGFYFSPLKLFEYMAAGLCPVVSAVGELPEFIEYGQAGVVIPPGDAHALSEALVALDQDRAWVREAGLRAKAAARTMPTWVDGARRVVEALSDMPAVLAPLSPGATS
jgi:glycosyltransferase involved in cell wall biosynthesis